MIQRSERSKEPLPNGGLQVLTDLITHQDATTWTAMSVFLAAELVLFALYVQALPRPDVYVMGTLGAFGTTVTIVSWFVLKRSNTYLETYYDLAKRRCHAQDSEIFDVKIKNIPKMGQLLNLLHVAFFMLWFGLTFVYILILWVLAVSA